MYAPRFARLTPVLALATLLLGPGAHAASFTSVVATLDPGNGTDLLVDTASTTRVRQSQVSVLASGANTFQTRYAMVVGTDSGQIAPLGSITETLVSSYTIALSVLASPGENWQILLDTTRVGALTVVDDGNGSASATLGAVTGSVTGGALSGSLGLAAVGTTTNSAAPTTSPNTPFNQLSSAVVSGVGTGAVQTVTLSFSWTGSTTSTRQGNNSDEAAVRMGLTSTAGLFTADDYPGLGGRSQALDGHFVSATLIPEPETAMMLALGLAGLAWSSRRRD